MSEVLGSETEHETFWLSIKLLYFVKLAVIYIHTGAAQGRGKGMKTMN